MKLIRRPTSPENTDGKRELAGVLLKRTLQMGGKWETESLNLLFFPSTQKNQSFRITIKIHVKKNCNK